MLDSFRSRIDLADPDRWRSVFMRSLSLLLIVLGLYRWAEIIGVVAFADGVGFAELSGAWQAATINLAVAFLVAATGLWMLARWGLVLWFYAAGSEIAMHTLFAGVFGFRLMPILGHLVLLGSYAALMTLARRIQADREQAERAGRQVAAEDRPVGTGRFTAGAKAKLAAMLARRRSAPAPAEAKPVAASDNTG